MNTKRVAVLFTGYGEQQIGMLKDLYDKNRFVQERFDQASLVINYNFIKGIFASSDQELSLIPYAYPSIYLVQTCLYDLLKEKGLQPEFVAGYGIGEYAAAYATQSLSFIDSLYILNKYATVFDAYVADKSFAVLRIIRGFTHESLQALIDQYSSELFQAYIMAVHGPEQFYIVGHTIVIEKIQDYCLQKVIRKVRMLTIGYGLHSPLAQPIVEALRFYYHKISFKSLQTPMITNVDAVYVTAPDALESAMMRKIDNPILWQDVLLGLEGCDVLIHIGPGKQEMEWAQALLPDKQHYFVMDEAAIDTVIQQLNSSAAEKDIEEDEDVTINLQGKDLYEADLINEKKSDFDVDDED